MNLYKYDGTKLNNFEKDCSLSYHFDSQSESFYYLLRINKVKTDGTKQYPFLRYFGETNKTTPRLLRKVEPWDIIINGGWGGMTIENSIVKDDSVASPEGICALTIDRNGNLGSIVGWEAGSGASLVNSGIVSATTTNFPLLINFQPYTRPSIPDMDTYNWQHAQRQVIGQWENGDYAIITSEGRGYNNSEGITTDRLITLCQELGLKFAYNLDGGGSTQTVVGDKTLNNIYEGTDGRLVPSFIVFNGTDTFSIPTN